MDDLAHRCLMGHELEDHVFAALRAREVRNRREGRASIALLLVALVLVWQGIHSPGLLQPLLTGTACGLWIVGLVLAVRSRQRLTYPEAFLAAGLEPLDLGGRLEVAAILAEAPDLRGELAAWVGPDLPLRERDLAELRRRAARCVASDATPWSLREPA